MTEPKKLKNPVKLFMSQIQTSTYVLMMRLIWTLRKAWIRLEIFRQWSRITYAVHNDHVPEDDTHLFIAALVLKCLDTLNYRGLLVLLRRQRVLLLFEDERFFNQIVKCRIYLSIEAHRRFLGLVNNERPAPETLLGESLSLLYIRIETMLQQSLCLVVGDRDVDKFVLFGSQRYLVENQVDLRERSQLGLG